MHEGPWHVLHVMANHEKKVAQHLSIRSLEHYVPLYTEQSQWTDRIVKLERPLFSGYVFVRFSPESRHPVITAPGVLRLLGDTQRDKVSDDEIRRIRESLEGGSLLRPHSSVPLGTRVRVRGGVFGGVEGIVTEFRQQCKVIIALGALQVCFSLEVELGDIQVLDKMSVRVDDSISSPRRNRIQGRVD